MAIQGDDGIDHPLKGDRAHEGPRDNIPVYFPRATLDHVLILVSDTG